MAEYEKDWDWFVLFLAYFYDVQVHQTTKLPTFNLAITGLLPDSFAKERVMRPDVGKIDSPFVSEIYLIHGVVLLRRLTDTNFRKAQADERRSTIYMSGSSYASLRATTLSLNALLKASAADGIAFERYFKLLPRRTWPFRVISLEPCTPRSARKAFEIPYHLTSQLEWPKKEDRPWMPRLL